MANATTRDARAGFAIYLQSSDGISLDEINARLKKSGYGPIAQRTLTHYRNLVRAGFNRYISINRFDVARTSRAYENLSSLGRYRYHPTYRSVDVLFAKNTRILEVHGHIVEVGDVGAILEFVDDDIVESLHAFRPRAGDSVSLRRTATSAAIEGSVIDIDFKRIPILVEMEYDRLISSGEFIAGIPLATYPTWIRISAEDNFSPTLDILGRRLHYFFDVLEGLRAVLNEAGRQCDQEIYASPPIIHELRLASPALLLLQLPPELVLLMPWTLLGGLYLLPKTIEMRKSWHEGSNLKKLGSVIDKAGSRLDAEVRLKELEVHSKEKEESFRTEVIDRVRSQIRESTISDRHLREIVGAYILPPFRTIETSDILEIHVVDETVDDSDAEDTGGDCSD